ncbi:MrcB family domain-containing protein [Lactobacillus kimbladii]|uniref:MrcB family domain-containing protein n=1 Tax=Lactobacillus kimbladii TaxID=1218506 RepID=UPI003AF51B48
MNLHDVLNEIMTNYIKESTKESTEKSTKNSFNGNSLAENIRSSYLKCFKENDSKSEKISEKNGFFVKGSAGQGNWAKIPWLGIFNKNMAKGPRQGFYLVYLFSEDMTKVYLSLNQGYTYFKKEYKKDALSYIEIISKYFQKNLLQYYESRGLKLLTSIKLQSQVSRNTLGRGYQKGNILAIEYEKESLPENEVLLTDLSNMLDIYKKLDSIIKKGIKDDVVVKRIVEKILKNKEDTVKKQEKYLDNHLIQNNEKLVDSVEGKIQKKELNLKKVDINKLKISKVKRTKKNVHQKSKRKKDFITAEIIDSSIGSLGEKIVFEDERRRLKKNKNKVIHVSENDDSRGYDIESVDDKGNTIYIEVKATTGPWYTPFYISQNEIDISKKKGKQYILKRLYNININKSKVDFFEIQGPLEDSKKINLEVVNYIAKLR